MIQRRSAVSLTSPSLAADLENDLTRAQRAEKRAAAAVEREAASNAALRETLSQTEEEVRKKQREIQVSSVGHSAAEDPHIFVC